MSPVQSRPAIFPLELRGPAKALCTVANCSFNFVVSYTFLTLAGDLGEAGTFWLYAVVGVIAVVFFARLVPGMKGRSLEEIQMTRSQDAKAEADRSSVNGLAADRPQHRSADQARSNP